MNHSNRIQLALLLLGGGLLSLFFIIQHNPPYANLLLYGVLGILSFAFLYAGKNVSHFSGDSSRNILNAAILLHLAILPLPVFFSDDVFRYIWDGIVQANAVNPYLYIPHAEELYPLREFASFEYMRDQFGIYSYFSPVLQVLFRFSIYLESIIGFQGMIFFYKGISIAINIGIISLLLDYVDEDRQTSVVWYAWNPLIILLICGQASLFHLPLLIILYFLKIWKQSQPELEAILWGILLHFSALFWFAFPLLFKKIGWKFSLLALFTWLAWWLPFLDFEGIQNYATMIWFNLHTAPENLSPFSLLQHTTEIISKVYAIVFLMGMSIISIRTYLRYELGNQTTFLMAFFNMAIIYFFFNPVWHPGIIAIIIGIIVLLQFHPSKTIPASLVFLLAIPVIVEDFAFIWIIHVAAGSFFLYYYYQMKSENFITE